MNARKTWFMENRHEGGFAQWDHELGKVLAATDRDVSSRRIGVEWKQNRVMRAGTARAPEVGQVAPICRGRWSRFMGSERPTGIRALGP